MTIPANSRPLKGRHCNHVSDPLLRELLEQRFLPQNVRLRCDQSRNQYRWALNNLDELLGRPAVLSDLTDETVTRLMVYLGDTRKLEPRTINDRRGRLNRFWRWLADKEYTRRRPTNEPLLVPDKDPEAWTEQQLRRLIRTCAMENDSIGDMPAATFWLAFHGMAWDSGARTMEILTGFYWERLDWQTGWIRVPAELRKGRRKPARYRFLPDVMALLFTFRQPSGLILNWDQHPSRFYQRYTELLTKAGLPSTRWDKPQKLRRSHATWLSFAGGDATRSLLHDSEAVTKKSYLDPNILSGPGHSIQLPFRVLDFARPADDEPLEVIAIPHDSTDLDTR